ncbi:MAG: hypothetical protein IJI74_06145 [Firmicutes bacterium]|nr:hypothetical protein [Bacillota bacterium]
MKRITEILLIALLVIGGVFFVPLSDGNSQAEQKPGDDPVVLQNEEGDEVVIDVEEELPADSQALQEQQKAAGIVEMEEDGVPLAGFDPVVAGKDNGDVHLIWMLLLLIAAIAYVIHFSRYQNRIFDLRRKIADAEYEVRKGGNQ